MTKKIAKKEEIDSTLAEEFEPTPHQIVWVDTAVKLGTISPTAISRECGVDRSNWSRGKWLGDEGFYDWFVTAWKKKRYHLLPELDQIGIKYAKRGSYSHWEAMNKKIGELEDKPQVAIQQNFDASSYLPDELSKKHGED